LYAYFGWRIDKISNTVFHGVHTEFHGVLVLHFKQNAPNNPDPNP